MTELDDAVAVAAECMSDALVKLGKKGPRLQAEMVAERLTEVAQDLHVAAVSTTAPDDYVGWSDLPNGSDTVPDALPPDFK